MMRKLLLLLLIVALPAHAQNKVHTLAGINPQTGTTYTFVPVDVTKVVTFNNTSPVTAILPAASTPGFGAGSIFTVKNIGTGNLTIQPASGTIDGQASIILVTGTGADIYSDGLNFTSVSGGGGGGGGGGNAVSLNVLGKGTGPGLTLVDSQCSDDSINPVRCQHGFNAAGGGITYEVANANPGTTLNRMVCNNGSGLATICPDNATSGILGVAQANPGTTGNVQVCKLISCSVEFDNQSVINDYAIVASSGRLHDTGSTTPTANNTNFLVQSANTGANTVGQVAPPGDLTGTVVGFANPMTTLGDTMYGGSAGVATRLPGPTTLNGVPQYPVSVATAGVAGAPAILPGGVVPRIVSGTSDTILLTDRGKFIQYTNASPVAVTVPQAGSTGFANNFYFCAENRGAGLVTFTPTTSTVNGGATYTLATSASGCFISDNANYITKDSSGGGGGGGSGTWNTITNPAGNLSLSMAANTSTFNTTTAAATFFNWKNTTAAVVGTSQGSPFLNLCGRAFHGSADVEDCLTINTLPGNSNDAPITFTIGHSGTSTGTVTTTFPGPISIPGDGVHPGNVLLVGNSTAPTPASNTFNIMGPNTASFTAYALQFPNAAPAANTVMLTGAPSAGVSQVTYAAVPHASIAPTAVSPGSYTSANITVAADGSITAAANGATATFDPQTTITQYDDFVGQGTAVNTLNWASYTGTIAHNAIGFGVVNLQTGATSGNTADLEHQYNEFEYDNIANWDMKIRFFNNVNTSVSEFVGQNDNSVVGEGANNEFGCAYDTVAGDTNYMYILRKASGTEQRVSSGVAVDGNFHTCRIHSLVSGTLRFSIDGGTETCFNSGGTGGCTASSQIPSAIVAPMFSVITRTTAARNIQIDYYWLNITGVTRP